MYIQCIIGIPVDSKEIEYQISSLSSLSLNLALNSMALNIISLRLVTDILLVYDVLGFFLQCSFIVHSSWYL